MNDMRDQRRFDPFDEVGEVYQTGVKPGAVTLTQHMPVQRKARTDARPAPTAPPPESFGFVQAYGGEVQARGDAAFPDERPTTWMAAAHGTSGAAGPLPHLDQIQQSFGRHDVSSVRAYTDGNAARGAGAMGAEAYATGDQVAFAGSPTLHTAAHEAAHVVQQRAGVALKGGVGQAGDAYERHADAVADTVVRGESAEALLDQMAGTGGGERAVQRSAPAAPAAPAAAASDLPPELAPLVGTTVSDDGGFTFKLEADGSFIITVAPPAHPQALGKSIRRHDPKLGGAWQQLVVKLQHEHPLPAAPATGAAPAAGAAATENQTAEAASSSAGSLVGNALGFLGAAVRAASDPVGSIGAMVSTLHDGLFGETPAAEVPPDAAEMDHQSPGAAPAAGGAAPAAGGAAPAAGGGGGATEGQAPAPGDTTSTVPTPAAATGPIDPANHQSRTSFKQANVPENATTTAILDAIWPHYNAGDHVIGGYLSSGQQYWKINYHWELVIWVCDTAATLVDEAHKASFTSIASTLRGHTPNPASGYLDDHNMALVDTSTQEAFDARYLAVKKAKTDLAAAITASGAQSKVTGGKADRFILSVQNVLPPGDNNKHGQGFSLDIKGSNARISETSKKLGATTTYDEKFHVHVEFKSGVSAPPSQPAAAAAPVQHKASGAAADSDVHEAAAHGTSGAAGPLPHLDQIQQSFGRHDVSSVRAYTDGNAARGAGAMGAEAYATGDQVAFAGSPTLHTAAHEAAHVVQQRAGVALKGGVGQAGDAYERHADAVADTVVRGESAESLLDQMAGTGGGERGERAVQKADGPNVGNNPQGGGPQQGAAQQGDQPDPVKAQAQGALASFMAQLTPDYVASVKGQDDVLLHILLVNFEANWFKAKDCLLFDKWPVPKPAPDQPPHAACLALMDALVEMRSKICKKVADETQKRMKGALRAELPRLNQQSPIVQQGMGQNFVGEVTGNASASDHFNPMAPTGAEKRTSDIDVASNGLNTEIGVRLFNETFREMLHVDWDPATVFDYNVYAMDWIFPKNFQKDDVRPERNLKTGEMEDVAHDITPMPEHVIGKDAGADHAAEDVQVQRNRDEILDDAALLHIRRNCKPGEWRTYSQTRLAQVDAADKPALAEKLQAVDQKHDRFLDEIAEKEEEIGAQIGVAQEAAQSAWNDSSHLDEAVDSRARNALYQERLLKVKALRLHYTTLKAKPQKSDEDVRTMARLATEVTAALTDAVFFANEVYATEGATLHATQGIQTVNKAKEKFGADVGVTVHLTDAHYMQSFHENVGDSLHSLGHFENDPKYAAYRAGKYIERMILAAAALAGEEHAQVLTGHGHYEALHALGVKAAAVKGSADGDDPEKINEHFAQHDGASVAGLRAAVISMGGEFPGQLARAKAAAAQRQQPQAQAAQPAQPEAQPARVAQAVQVEQAQQQVPAPPQGPAPAPPQQQAPAPPQQQAPAPPQQQAARGLLARALEALAALVEGFVSRFRR